MALASEEEWESDPELKQMRKDFVASFEGRRLALEALYPALRQGANAGAAYEDAVRGAIHVAHKLAGAAETYGFPTLTRAAAAIDDSGSCSLEAAQLLSEMLAGAQALGKDDSRFTSDPRFERLLKLAR